MSLPVSTLSAWQRLGDPEPDTLTDARLQLHWASQIAASVGYTYVEPAPDWSHTSLAWLGAHDALAGPLTAIQTPFRAALRLPDLTLLLLDPENKVLDAFSLNGQTLGAGYAWLAAAIGAHTGLERSLVRPDHELPEHPADAGAAFALNAPAAFAELSRWYANADGLLHTVRAANPEASPVRTWPHHFDIATLLTFDADKDAEEARSIGVGLSPGDGSYAEPYWYLTPWPYPDNPSLPPLEGNGTWHQDGWFGAVLTATRLVAVGTADAQAECVHAFIRSGLDASRALLELAAP